MKLGIKSFLYSLVGLIFLTAGGIGMYVYDRFTLSPQLKRELLTFSKSPHSYRIGLTSRKSLLGENEHAAKIAKVLNDLGWSYYIYMGPKNKKASFYNDFQYIIHKWVLKVINPDFVLSLCERLPRPPAEFSYVYIGMGGNYVNSKGLPTSQGSFIQEYDAFFPCTTDTSWLQIALKKLKKKPHILQIYISAYAMEYVPLSYKKLFYCGNNWDQRRKSKGYKSLFTFLESQGYLAVYGKKKDWPALTSALHAPLPFDGHSLIQAIQENGIVLCLHSTHHLKSGAPTARIFEAAAAGAVIISDRHPFIMTEFGDSVLYIDESKDPQTMAQEIDSHMRWIQSHPVESEQKARKAHQIFVEKFSIDKQLQKIVQLYEEDKKGRKELSL
jgi:hypothetical protein